MRSRLSTHPRASDLSASENPRENDTAASTAIDSAIRARVSARAFRPDPVPRSLLVEVFDVARMAPSTFNTQPWRAHILARNARRALSARILEAHDANACPQFTPFPATRPADCALRQNDFGERLYSALQIDRADIEGRGRQTARNYLFFDAPVGLVFTIDGTLTKHSWLDYGLFLQNIMLAAHARGLASCPQVSFVRYQSVISEHLKLPPGEAVVCGMSLGYADEQAAVNRLAMPREPVEAFTTWSGFDE